MQDKLLNPAKNTNLQEWRNVAKTLYQFLDYYYDYENQPKDYGTGEMINMVEVHVLTAIYDQPEITVTQLAADFNRTKSAISQIVTKLVKKGLVIRQNHETNKKTILLLPTQEGKRLSRAHKKYDAADEAETLEILLQNCTMDEIRSFHKVLQCYNKLFQEEPDNP